MLILNNVNNMQLLEGWRNLFKSNRVPAFSESLLFFMGRGNLGPTMHEITCAAGTLTREL
jgi:hypothetical protein